MINFIWQIKNALRRKGVREKVKGLWALVWETRGHDSVLGSVEQHGQLSWGRSVLIHIFPPYSALLTLSAQ